MTIDIPGLFLTDINPYICYVASICLTIAYVARRFTAVPS